MNEKTKYCKFCGKEKPIKDFVKSGFCVKNICKDCNNKKQKEVYKNSKNYHKLQQENKQLKEQLQLKEDIINKAKEHLELKVIRYSNETDYMLDETDLKEIIQILDNKGGMKDE